MVDEGRIDGTEPAVDLPVENDLKRVKAFEQYCCIKRMNEMGESGELIVGCSMFHVPICGCRNYSFDST